MKNLQAAPSLTGSVASAPNACPNCHSEGLAFVEHMAHVTVYRCRWCERQQTVPLRSLLSD